MTYYTMSIYSAAAVFVLVLWPANVARRAVAVIGTDVRQTDCRQSEGDKDC